MYAWSVSSRTPWVRKLGYSCIQEILVVMWLYTHRPAHLSAPQDNQCEMIFFSLFESLQHVFNLIIDIHVMVNWQLSKMIICWPCQYHMTILWAQVSTYRGPLVFKVFWATDQLLAFNIDRRLNLSSIISVYTSAFLCNSSKFTVQVNYNCDDSSTGYQSVLEKTKLKTDKSTVLLKNGLTWIVMNFCLY